MSGPFRGGLQPPDAGRPLHVFCLLPTLNAYGGVVSVINLLNAMVMQGHRVTLASMSRHGHDSVGPYCEPIHVDDLADLGRHVPADVDVLLATSWETVDAIVDVGGDRSNAALWYYVQDFEADFYPASDERSLRARATYDRIPNRIVKTQHLLERLSDEGGWDAHRVRPGMNLDIFHPRQVARHPLRVLSMARPAADQRTDNRGFGTLSEVYRLLTTLVPDVELVAFGNHDEVDWDVPVETLGRVDPTDLPALYSTAAVYVDTSRFHGFGRTGVEAMACGAGVVLTDSGGISEYAVDGVNALVRPVGDADAIAQAIATLLEDPARLDALREQGLETVKRFDDRLATAEIVELFRGSVG